MSDKQIVVGHIAHIHPSSLAALVVAASTIEPIEPMPVPDTVAAMQQLMEQARRDFDDVIGIGAIELRPIRQGKSAFAAMQKMLIDRYADPGIFIPPIQRGHPTSPRKHKK